jgi:hypothetical protein
MSRRDRKAASDSRDFLLAATSVGWVGAHAGLTEAQVAQLLGCFREPPSEAAARLFSTYAPLIFMHAQALQLVPAGFPAAGSNRSNTKPRRNVTTVIRDEVKQLRSRIQAFETSLGKVSDQAIHAVDRSLGPEERIRFWPPLAEEQGMTAVLRRARNALSDLELALSRVRVTVDRGRQADATRMTVKALALLYIDVAGRDPKRSYDHGETGAFLKLARAFMTMVRDALPAAARSHISLSLSKVVREVLAELRS